MTKKMQRMIVCICILVAGCCIGFMAQHYMAQNRAEVAYDNIEEEVYVQEEVVVDAQEDEEVEEREPIENPIDFDALHEINPDVYAWIEIVGTDVSYPILQSADDDGYYLDHTIENVDTLPGSIYTEAANGQDFDVFNTIIYGHNMSNETMFGSLYRFREESYMLEHETIMIYTEDAVLEYQIYSAATFSNTHLLYKYDFTDDLEKQEFLDDTFDAKDMSKMIRDDVEVSVDDQIITLSTCISGQSDNRLLVEAVLVYEQRESE